MQRDVRYRLKLPRAKANAAHRRLAALLDVYTVSLLIENGGPPTAAAAALIGCESNGCVRNMSIKQANGSILYVLYTSSICQTDGHYRSHSKSELYVGFLTFGLWIGLDYYYIFWWELVFHF